MNQEPVLIKGVVAFPNPNGNREIRFIDAFYHDLFKIPDHSSIVINYLDGGKRCVPCEYIDDTHVDIDGTAFHICQFAELMMRNGATYEPEHPPAEPTYGTYEIYQIKDVGRVDYCFMGYERAKKQFDPSDYRREYAYIRFHIAEHLGKIHVGQRCAGRQPWRQENRILCGQLRLSGSQAVFQAESAEKE